MNFARLAQLSSGVAMLATFAISVTATGLGAVAATSVIYVVGATFYFIHCVVDPRRGALSLMVGFYFLFLVAVPTYVQIERQTFPFYSSYSSAQLAGGFVVLATAHFALILGQALCRSGAPTPAQQRTSYDTGPPLLLYRRFAVAMLGLSVLLAAAIGPAVIFLTREERGTMAEGGIGLQLLYVGRSTSLVALCLCVLLMRQKRPHRPAWVPELAVIAVMVFLVLNYPPGLSRFQLLGSALAIAVLTTSFFRTSRKMIFGLAAPFFLFLFFPFVKALGTGDGLDISGVLSRDVGAYMVRVDFDSFKQIVDTTIYASDHEALNGVNFLGAALFWIPRALWPSKPGSTGELVSTELGYPYNNVSSPLPAEALVSFGPIGVLVVLGLFGLAIAKIELGVRQQRGADIHQTLLYAVATGFVTILLRGALVGVAPIVGSSFVLIGALWLLVARGRTRHGESSSPLASETVSSDRRPARPSGPNGGEMGCLGRRNRSGS